MLFATYQIKPVNPPIESNLPIYSNIPHDDRFGFSPIFCYPVTDYKSFIAHSLCTEPTAPMWFYIFRCDEYIQIDKIKHYSTILKGDLQTFPSNDNSISMDYSEFVIDSKFLNFNNIVCASPIFMGIRESIQFILPHLSENNDVLDGLAHDIASYAKFIKYMFFKFDFDCISDSSHDEQKIKIVKMLRNQKMFFDFLVLPLLYRNFIYNNYEYYSYITMSLLYNLESLIRRTGDFSLWALNDCSYDNYNVIFNSIKDSIIDVNDDVLLQLYHDDFFKSDDIQKITKFFNSQKKRVNKKKRSKYKLH